MAVGDARLLLAALLAPSGELAFLAGHLDPERRGEARISAGSEPGQSTPNVVTGSGPESQDTQRDRSAPAVDPGPGCSGDP